MGSIFEKSLFQLQRSFPSEWYLQINSFLWFGIDLHFKEESINIWKKTRINNMSLLNGGNIRNGVFYPSLKLFQPESKGSDFTYLVDQLGIWYNIKSISNYDILAIVLHCCSLDSTVAKLVADTKLKSLTNYVSRGKWLPTSFSRKILAKNPVICYYCILIGNSPRKMNNATFFRKRENPIGGLISRKNKNTFAFVSKNIPFEIYD